MQINITVSDVDLTSVIGETHGYDADGEYTGRVPQTLGDAVAAKIAEDLKRDETYKALKRQVMELREAEVRAQLKPIVEAAIAAPVQRTDGYGAPTGEPITLTSLIMAEVQQYLNRRVGSGYNSPSTTFVQKFVKEAVDNAIKKELAEAIVEEKAKVVATVRAKAAELIADAVRQGIGR